MQLKETMLCGPVQLFIDNDSVTTLDLTTEAAKYPISLCREQAQQLLPILEHFIKTGELPDAS